MIETLAGTGEPGFNRDGILAVRGQLSHPRGLAPDRFGNLYVADLCNYRIRRIDATGVITTVAGTGKREHAGDGGKAIQASLEGPSALAVDSSGNLYIAEFHYNRIRKIDPNGFITTIAGAERQVRGGDGGPAADALLDHPAGLAVDHEGSLYFSERGSHRVRKIAPDGSIGTIAGTGMAGYIGDGGPAADALLWHPRGLVVDKEGNLFVSDSGNHRVRRIDRAGVITTVAGTGMSEYSGDGGPAILGQLFAPDGLAADRDGNLYVADVSNHRVRRIDRAGVLTTVVGTGEIGSWGDGCPASQACVTQPEALAVDRDGFLLVSDSGNHRVRIVRPENRVSVKLGEGGESCEFDFAAYGILWRAGSPHADGSEVTARDGSTFVLRLGPDGAYSATRATRRHGSQLIALPGGALVRLIPQGDGTWRMGSDTVASGHRFVREGTERVLDFFGGCWRLMEHTLLDLVWKPDTLDGVPAVQADLDGPSDVAVDSRGNVYVAEYGSGRIRRVDRDGLITTVVDDRRAEVDGSLEPALRNLVFTPQRLGADRQGNLYYSEQASGRICKSDLGGSLSTLAGMGPFHRGRSGEGGRAAKALLSTVGGIASDASGQVYFADMYNHCVRRVDALGVIATIAGAGRPGFGGDGGPAREALLDSPTGLAVDESGSVYVCDTRNARVRRIDRDGIIETVAGGGEPKLATGDGCSATTAHLGGPTGLAADTDGNVYIVDTDMHRLRRVTPDGVISTLAGTGNRGRDGDFGPAAAADLNWPCGVVADAQGRVYISDTANHQVRRIGRDGRIETIAGTGKPGLRGDGGQARKSMLRRPGGVAVDRAGTVYIADMGNHRIRKVDPSGLISTVAGTGNSGLGDDGGQAPGAVLDKPFGVAIDASGNVYFSDIGNHRIQKIDPSGTVSTVAGKGEPGYSGDGGPAAGAMLHCPAMIATDASGNLYCADRDNQRVRKIDSEGIISTLAGSGRCGYGGDRGPAEEAFLDSPMGVLVDQAGNVYVADKGNARVRKIDGAGIITTFAGGGEVFSTGDGGPAEVAHFGDPQGIALDASGSVYVADMHRNRIRKFRPGGRVTTFAGTGEGAFGGDGGPAAKALLCRPEGLAVDDNGNVYVADSGNGRVRRIDQSGVINTIAGTGRTPTKWEGGPANTSLIQGIAADALDRLCMLAQDCVWRLDDSGTVSLIAGAASDSSGEGLFDRAARLAADHLGNLYVAEERKVLRIDPAGTVTTVAGTGERAGGWQRPNPDPRDYPTWVGVDADGNVYYLDAQRMRIRKIDASGEIATAVDLRIWLPPEELPDLAGMWRSKDCIALDADGNLYLASSRKNRIYKFDAAGNLSMFAGTGKDGGSGDGGPATHAQLASPTVIGTDESGNLYVVELCAERIRKIDSFGTISTVAGPSKDGSSTADDFAIPTEIGEVTSLAADVAGNVYVSISESDCILRIDPFGAVRIIAGTGGFARLVGEDLRGIDHDGPAAAARFSWPTALAADGSGTICVADSAHHRVCAISPQGAIKTIAGTGEPGFSGDGGPATQATLQHPSGVAVDAAGNVYIGDSGNRSLRKVDTSGMINSIYHELPPPPVDTLSGYEGDGGPAVQSRFVGPLDIAADSQGNVYVADAGDHRVRKINADGTITMFAGTGKRGDEGDGGPACEARLDTPFRITVDSTGSVYVADKETFRVRKIDPNGDIVTAAGTGTKGGSGDDGPAIEADVDVRDIAADSAGNLFLVDGKRVRQVATSGVISTIAGSGRILADGDGGSPVNAHLIPRLVATSRTGDVWFVDGASDRVRALRPNPLQAGWRTYLSRGRT